MHDKVLKVTIDVIQLLSQQSLVKKVSWEETKSTNLFEEYSKHKLIIVVNELVTDGLSCNR
jgi:hypothetical protein